MQPTYNRSVSLNRFNLLSLSAAAACTLFCFGIHATTCPTGYFLSDTTCAFCPPGYYCPGDNNQYVCPAQTFSAQGSEECKPCPQGYTSEPGSASCTPATSVRGGSTDYREHASGAAEHLSNRVRLFDLRGRCLHGDGNTSHAGCHAAVNQLSPGLEVHSGARPGRHLVAQW